MAKKTEKMNLFFKTMLKAKKSKSKSFKYKGKTYIGEKHKHLGMVYKKSGGANPPKRQPSAESHTGGPPAPKIPWGEPTFTHANRVKGLPPRQWNNEKGECVERPRCGSFPRNEEANPSSASSNHYGDGQ